jgi:putative membrane protein insertion efficiency factor
MKTLVLALLGFYRSTISPTWPSACKFYPSCSAYAAQAVERYGPARGLWMAAGRILRCRPFHAGGIDPVPTPPYGE